MKYIAPVFLLLMACQPNREPQLRASAAMAPPAILREVAFESNEKPIESTEFLGDLVLKSADVKFQVKDVEKSTKSIEKIVAARQAVIASQNQASATTEILNVITIRVPSSQFEILLEDMLKEASFVNYKRISSQNVTEEYQDIVTRLKTKKEVRDRYTEILRTKAKSVEDILKAEEHIRALQEEIEAKEGRLNFLKSRVSMSEINLEVYQKVIYKETPSVIEKPFIAEVKQSFGSGWSLVTSAALFVINTWPLLLLALAVYWKWRRWRRKMIAVE